MRRGLTLDLAAAFARHLASTVAGVLTVAIIARKLGADRLGAWTILATASYLVGLAELGTTANVQRASTSDDPRAAERALGVSLAVVIVVAPLLAVATVGGGAVAMGTATIARGELAIATTLLVAAGVAGALSFPLRALLLVRARVRDVSIARGVGAALQIAVLFGAVELGRTLAAPALALLVAQAAETTVLFVALARRHPETRLSPRFHALRHELRPALRVGAASLAINGAVVLAARFDFFVLGAIAPLGAVAAYGVASRACDQALTFAKQTSSAMLGRIAARDERAFAVRFGAVVLHVVAGSGLAAIAVLGRPVLGAWAGPIAAVEDGTLPILAAGAVAAAWTEIPSATLALVAPSPWVAARPILVGAVINVALTLAGAKLGLVAIAGATLAGAVVASTLAWRNVAATLGWSLVDVARALVPGFVALVASLAAALAVRSETSVAHPWHALAIIAAVSAVGVAAGGLAALAILRRAKGQPTSRQRADLASVVSITST